MILGIESSCDESALTLLDPSQGFRGEWVYSQQAMHLKYGGVVPDLASRDHAQRFAAMLDACSAVILAKPIETVAVTVGPGLAGCLAMGVALAQSLSIACRGVRVLPVNHLWGHAVSPFIPLWLSDSAGFAQHFKEQLPHLGLLVSGGNTILFEMNLEGAVHILARTVDDAAGEALDKGAKLMGLGYPGGARIETLAQGADRARYDFPRAFPRVSDMKFSFSGLKTSLRYLLEKLDDASFQKELPDLCAAYQEAVVAALAKKVAQVLKIRRYKSLGLSGGVANNGRLREVLMTLAKNEQLAFLPANKEHTGDNASMIAMAAWMQSSGWVSPAPLALDIYPNLTL